MHLYMPWWLDNKKLDFPRGYHIEVWGGRGMPGYGFMGGIQGFPGAGRRVRRGRSRTTTAATTARSIGFSGRGEMIPNDDSYCELDPDTVDRWGIPVLRFHWKWTDHEFNQVKHMQETFRALIARDGRHGDVGRCRARTDGYGIAAGGRSSTSSAASRMGSDPKTSVLNANCQAHDVKNLFVADGGPFVSQADKNPTWTILALVDADQRRHRRPQKQGAL